MEFKLVVTNNTSKEVSVVPLNVEKKVIIGRHLESPVQLQGEGLSRHHFSLTLIDGALAVADLSSNGTWLNGEQLKAQTTSRVKSGDIIEIPGYNFQVQSEDAGASLQKQGAVSPVAAAPAAKPVPAWQRPLVAALHFLEPAEVVLLLTVVATVMLISFYANR
jgi:pSer/pThr/pTyr-binding forkhead associated (FHA) protein